MTTIRLTMANNSVRNTTISCDSLGIQYGVAKSGGIVSVYRWDTSTSRNILVGQFKLAVWRSLIRFRKEDPWMQLKGFLSQGDGFHWYLFPIEYQIRQL